MIVHEGHNGSDAGAGRCKMPEHMRAIAAGVTDVGRERDHNEDRFVLVPEFEVFVVADGMGGHQCGEVASRMATSTIAGYFRSQRLNGSDGSVGELLRASVVEANQRIHRRATMSAVHRGMGTTVVAAAFSRGDSRIWVAHAGDSRCYRSRAGDLAQITRDHSLIEEALRTRPDITESELSYLPGNVITRALGVEPVVDVDVTSDEVNIGDVYLLCSDGLHGFVTDERINEILQQTPIITNACADLIGEANANGGGDNITAVLIKIEELDEPWAVSTSVPPAPGRAVVGPPASAVRSSAVPNITVGGAAGDDERAALEVEDTAQFEAIQDPDKILAGRLFEDEDTQD
jgi:PPM family protein phosphatase